MIINEFQICNKNVIVIEDFYDKQAEIESLYLESFSLPFYIKHKPTEDIQNRHNLRMISDLNDNILNNIKLFEGQRKDFFEKYVPNHKYTILKAYCNLGLVSDYQDIHVDCYTPNQVMTLLIYCNKEWKDNWGGETYFYSDDMKKVEYVSTIKKGKAILFDGSIPHMAKVQHNYSDNYRLTVALKFLKIGAVAHKENYHSIGQ